MARGQRSSGSSSMRSNQTRTSSNSANRSRSSSTAAHPPVSKTQQRTSPQTQQHQPQQPSMMSSIGRGLATGVAFGVGSELVRGLFGGHGSVSHEGSDSNTGAGSEYQGQDQQNKKNYNFSLFALLLSVGSTFGVYKYYLNPRFPAMAKMYSIPVFAGSFLILNTFVNSQGQSASLPDQQYYDNHNNQSQYNYQVPQEFSNQK